MLDGRSLLTLVAVRFVGSYNDYSVLPDHDALRAKFEKSQKSFTEIYESVKIQLEQSMQPDQREYLQKALKVANKVPGDAAVNGRTQPVDSDEEQAWKNCWNWNLSEAAFGNLVFEIKEGRVSAKTSSQGTSRALRDDLELTPRQVSTLDTDDISKGKYKCLPRSICPTPAAHLCSRHPRKFSHRSRSMVKWHESRSRRALCEDKT